MATKVVDVTRVESKDLPPNQASFHVSYTDPDSGKTFADDFTVKRLNLGDIRRVSIRKAQLSGGLPADALEDGASYFNSMLAHLEQAIVKAPTWWKPEEFYDITAVTAVYKEVMAFEDSFRKAPSQQPQVTPSVGQGPVARPDGHAAAVVGG